MCGWNWEVKPVTVVHPGDRIRSPVVKLLNSLHKKLLFTKSKKIASKRFKQSHGWQISNELLKEHGMLEMIFLVCEAGTKINHFLPQHPWRHSCPTEDLGYKRVLPQHGALPGLLSNLPWIHQKFLSLLSLWLYRHKPGLLGSIYLVFVH